MREREALRRPDDALAKMINCTDYIQLRLLRLLRCTRQRRSAVSIISKKWLSVVAPRARGRVPARANTRDELFINHYHLLIIHYLSFINHLWFNHLLIIYLSFY